MRLLRKIFHLLAEQVLHTLEISTKVQGVYEETQTSFHTSGIVVCYLV